MQMKQLGRLWPVSRLALGGGGLGMLWGATTRAECVATFHDAVAAGVTLLDMAPRYGDGLAEEILGEAFAGRLPAAVRVTTKCLLGSTPPDAIAGTLRRSLEDSLRRMRLDRVDVFFLHSNICADDSPLVGHPLAATRMTTYGNYRRHVAPVFEALKADGLIGAWGLTGIGHPDSIIRALGDMPRPDVVQSIANPLDSPGSLKFFDGPARPREVIAAAAANGVGVLGIRAVQAGALTAALARDLPPDHPEMRDYARAAGFRALAAELGENPALLAHRYALSMPGGDAVVLGVKNRRELAECVACLNAGPLDGATMARIDSSFRPANT